MITRDATLKYRNLLGHYKENNAVRLRFDLTKFEKDFPGGKGRCFAQRHGETSRYPVELTIDGNSAYWTVTESDVSIPGNGRCELEWLVDDTVVKSEIYGTMVLDSLKDGPEPPDAAGKAWYEKIEAEIGNLDDLKTEAKDDLVSAINEAAQAELPPIDESTKDMALYNDGEKAEWREQRNPIPDYQENDPESPNYIQNRNGGYYEQGEQFLNAVYPFNNFQIPVAYKNDNPVVCVNVNDTDGTKTFWKAFSYFCEKCNLETVGFYLRYTGPVANGNEQYSYILEYKDGTKSVRMYDATPVIWPSDFIPIAKINTAGVVRVGNELQEDYHYGYSDTAITPEGAIVTPMYMILVNTFEWSQADGPTQNGQKAFYYETVSRGWILKSSNYLMEKLGIASADFPIQIISEGSVYGSGVPYMNCVFSTKTGKTGEFAWRFTGSVIDSYLNDSSDIFVVRFTQNDGTWSADKSYAEIKRALTDGKVVQGVVNETTAIAIDQSDANQVEFRFDIIIPEVQANNIGDIFVSVLDIIVAPDGTTGTFTDDYRSVIAPMQTILVVKNNDNYFSQLAALGEHFDDPLTYIVKFMGSMMISCLSTLTVLFGESGEGLPSRYYYSDVVITPDSATSSIKIDYIFKSADATKTLIGSVTRPNNWDKNTPLDETWTYIEADPLDGAVRYDKSQSLTDAQKQQARDNIGVVDVPTPSAENVGKIPVSKQVGDGYKYVMEDKSTSDLSLGLTGASVGQVPVVESVDTQGKPTAWKPSSAPGILSVTISPSDNPDEFTCDKTNAEIYEAFSAGKIVICDFIGQSRMQCVEAGAEYAVFLAISSGNGAASVNGVDISMNGDTQTVYVRDEVMLVAVPSSPDNAGRLITFDMMGAPFITQFNGLLYGEQDGSVTSLGVVTEDDNGKFLRVVDGMWQAVTVDNANGVSF